VGAGVVYAVIIAMWAIVLVPMWLQRHDEANEVRSVSRFSVAMRSLSRTGVVETVTQAPVTRPVRRTAAQRAAAARRRTVLLGLSLASLLTVAASLFGVVPVWSGAIPATLLLAFLALTWQVVHRTAAVAPVAARAQTDPVASLVRKYESEPVLEPAVPALRPGEWVATSIPLPTYVTAPPATRVPRLLDLRTPGRWTSAAMLDQVQAQKQAKVQMKSFADLFVDDMPAVDVGEDTLDFVIDRRAVNG
jgi:hypothetical protein